MSEKEIREIAKEYAEKGYYRTGVNPSYVEGVIYEALIELNNHFLKVLQTSSATNNSANTAIT